MTTDIIWGDTAFRTASDAAAAIFEDYMYADGFNGEEDVADFLATQTDDELVDDLLSNWPSVEETVSRDDLIAAAAAFRGKR